MLMVLSPAKSLNVERPQARLPLSAPELMDDVAELAEVTARLRAADLKRLMKLSDDLAELNRERFQAFDPTSEEGLQAALAFNGDVYQGLRARELDKKALAWAQDRVRILSGLYGVLRPLDAIQPYRLEMGTRLKTRRGPNLYRFWGDRIARALNEASRGHKDRTLVNLASQEYFAAVDLEEKGGQAKVISFYAKRARGMAARWAIDHRIDKAEKLKGFDVAGYRFSEDLSSEAEWTFVRPQPPPAGAAKES
jgi:cytoplasmic iron level regulating protein YaaA (DUF328/UPF0246 family)